jgi:hypothetical protein
MKRALTYTASIIGLAIGLVAGSVPALGATNAVGPYYATPSWDQTLPAASRFIVLTNMNSDAVLDRETGLVWEKSPSTSTVIWVAAQGHCNQLTVANRIGWRLPTLQELASLADPSVSPGVTLPSGHPFTNVQPSFYWSATTRSTTNDSEAWGVFFNDGVVSAFPKSQSGFFFWCVRGGQGVDPQ